MTTDRLAALLHEPCIESFRNWPGRTQHGPEAHETEAARLAAAGVTVVQLAHDPNMGKPEWVVDCGIASCPFRGVPHVGHAETVSSGNGIAAQPAPDALRADPEPLHGEIERLLIGMVRTSHPMDRTQYERGWNEALHAARKKVTDLMRSRVFGRG